MDDFTIQNDSNMKTCPESFWWSLFIPKKLLLIFLVQISNNRFCHAAFLWYFLRIQICCHHTFRYEFFRTQLTTCMRISLPNHMGLFKLWRVKSPQNAKTSLGTSFLKRVRQLQKLRENIVLSFFKNFPNKNIGQLQTLCFFFKIYSKTKALWFPIYGRRFWLDLWFLV